MLRLAPAGAGATPRIDYSKNSATGEYQPQIVHKDCSRNGAIGDFAPAVNVPRAAAVTRAASRANDDSFDWGAAALGAGTMLLAVLLVRITTTQARRRRIASPSPTGPSAA